MLRGLSGKSTQDGQKGFKIRHRYFGNEDVHYVLRPVSPNALVARLCFLVRQIFNIATL